ncbi:hypothetical protein BZK42_27480 [Citrobacter braakii]|uniref:Transposase (putative) YhgA-like domain-containing protein n=1 Tax=Citrobacter braakii TaxID=57706 RepID=A0A1V8NRA3_CITBR|nr:hypothetical protein [Salmonella enterica subsp. enterica serovar Coeln]OQM38952.1 hypothetical protein BZK42_27480 [Citrobacter braakii]QXC16536.1 Rpn family recombination-promoting nuclease/putative transposase [Citrobacter braakii]
MMAWRMMKYTIRAMDDHLKKGYKTLPVVVPRLFYHGDVRPYPYSMDWLDCFEQSELARRVLSKPWPLIDVSVLDDDDIKTHRRMALIDDGVSPEVVMKTMGLSREELEQPRH